MQGAEPAKNHLIQLRRRVGVAKNSMLSTVYDRVNQRLCTAKVHVREAQGHHWRLPALPCATWSAELPAARSRAIDLLIKLSRWQRRPVSGREGCKAHVRVESTRERPLWGCFACLLYCVDGGQLITPSHLPFAPAILHPSVKRKLKRKLEEPGGSNNMLCYTSSAPA